MESGAGVRVAALCVFDGGKKVLVELLRADAKRLQRLRERLMGRVC